MGKHRTVGLAAGLAGMAFIAAVAMPTRALERAPTARNEPLAEVLAELRALRLAMERSNALVPRVQLNIARLNIEEQRLVQLTVRVEQIRQQITEVMLESQQLSERLVEIEQSLQLTTDENVKRSSEDEQRRLKKALRRQKAIEQQLRVSENDATQALNIEQSRWNALNDRLDELEALLTPAPDGRSRNPR